MHAKGKQVSVDSFGYVWNAPNETWWPSLLPLVDHLNAMDYEEFGRNSGDGLTWRLYSGQKAKAGKNLYKLNFGMPSYEDSWQGDAALSQINWVRFQAGRAGVAIWDAQHAGGRLADSRGLEGAEGDSRAGRIEPLARIPRRGSHARGHQMRRWSPP